MKKVLLILLLCCVVAVAGCQKPDLKREPADIDAALEKTMEYWDGGKWVKIASTDIRKPVKGEPGKYESIFDE